MKKANPPAAKAVVKKTKKILAREQFVKDLVKLVERFPQLSDSFKGMPAVLISKGDPYIDESGKLQNFKVNPAFVEWAIKRSAELQTDYLKELFDFL